MVDIDTDSQFPSEPRKPASASELAVHFVIQFRKLGRIYGGCFCAIMVIGAITTFTISPYRPENDKITEYYGIFNPCIFFDRAWRPSLLAWRSTPLPA